MILLYFWEGLKNRTLFWILDIILNRQHTGATNLIENKIEHPQQFEVVIRLKPRALHHQGDVSPNGFDIVHGVSHDKGPRRRAADDDKFRRLPKRRKIATVHHIAAQDAANHDNVSEDELH